MKKISSQIESLAIAGLFLATLYYGVNGVRWCENIFLFTTNIYLAAVALLLSKKEGSMVISRTYNQGWHLPLWVDAVVAVVIISVCAAAGWFWSATAHVIIATLDFNARREAAK